MNVQNLATFVEEETVKTVEQLKLPKVTARLILLHLPLCPFGKEGMACGCFISLFSPCFLLHFENLDCSVEVDYQKCLLKKLFQLMEVLEWV